MRQTGRAAPRGGLFERKARAGPASSRGRYTSSEATATSRGRGHLDATVVTHTRAVVPPRPAASPSMAPGERRLDVRLAQELLHLIVYKWTSACTSTNNTGYFRHLYHDMLVSEAHFLPNPSDTKTEFVRG